MSAITSSSPQVNAVIPSKEEVDPVSDEVSALMENTCSLLVSQDQKMERELAKVKQAHEVAKKEWESSYAALAAENRQLRTQLASSQGRNRELESTHQREINAFREALSSANERRQWIELKLNKREYQIKFTTQYIEGILKDCMDENCNILPLWSSPQYNHLRANGKIVNKDLGEAYLVDFNNDAHWLYPSSTFLAGSTAEPTFTTTSSSFKSS
jgi:hypothetical protein